jgi:hypothetical protein
MAASTQQQTAIASAARKCLCDRCTILAEIRGEVWQANSKKRGTELIRLQLVKSLYQTLQLYNIAISLVLSQHLCGECFVKRNL